jgi:hypothetical protein
MTTVVDRLAPLEEGIVSLKRVIAGYDAALRNASEERKDKIPAERYLMETLPLLSRAD